MAAVADVAATTVLVVRTVRRCAYALVRPIYERTIICHLSVVVVAAKFKQTPAGVNDECGIRLVPI